MKSLYKLYLNQLGDIPTFLLPYLNIPSLVRLKEIGYFCGMDYASKDVYNFKENISRYDHSLTVAMITWKFTNDKKSTLAALFHDIATPCFSHVIDYMNGDYINQESTEEYTESILENDKLLNKLLKKDNINLSEVANFKNYSIVDNNRPKLCADRFDGIILPGIAWTKTILSDDIISLVNDLDVFNDEDGNLELGFKSLNTTKKAILTSELIDKYCHSNEDNYMMELLAKITRIAIDNLIIEYKDLYYLKEKDLLNNIRKSNNSEILSLLNKFETIKKEEIPEVKLDNVKIRNLKPLVNGTRVK